MSLSTTIERGKCKPWGLDGGLPGDGNAVAVRTNGKRQYDLPNAKLMNLRLRKGDAFMIRSGGVVGSATRGNVIYHKFLSISAKAM